MTDFLAQLYEKQLIVYGTGNVGKAVIPYLLRNPNINLCGVTNSRIDTADGGTFGETGLPIRSLSAWKNDFPNATILVAAFDGYDEIYAVCKNEGFHEIIFAQQELISASVTSSETIAEIRSLGGLAALCLANEIRDVHKASFSEFKACHRGEDVAVLGCGPTLKYYSQLPGIVHIGTNSCFLRENLKLDYHFQVDYFPGWSEKLKNHNFVKFFRVNLRENSNWIFPEYVIEENKARKFFQAALTDKIQTNIEYYPLMGFSSVIFSAIHFAFYTRARRIFLIGCDCASNGHFDDRPQNLAMDIMGIPVLLEGYRRVKLFAAKHYPDVEIVSVNPVGLKGMFQDVYTQEYLAAHREMDSSGCKILKPEDL